MSTRRRPARLARLLLIALAVSACTPETSPTTAPPTSGAPTTSERTTSAPPVDEATTTTVSERSPAEPAVVLGAPAPSPHLPMAAGPDRLVVYEPPFLVTHTVDGTESMRIPEHAPGVGEFIDVSSVVHWNDRFWAFLIGDLTTGPGRATALVSDDGISWARVDVGAPAAGARLPGGLATPDVPQYAGSSGVQAASGSGTRLVAAGWTRTDAGVQPTVWTTEDGSTWSTRVPPSSGQERVLAAEVASGADGVLVHTLGSTYAGQDLHLLGPEESRDVSLVGDQVVSDLVRSGPGFVLSSHAFFAPPAVLWEWDGDGWISIEEPDMAERRTDDAELRPYLLAGSAAGAIAAGTDELALRRDGRWESLGSVRGTVLSLTAGDGLVRVVSGDGASILITEVPLG